MLMRPDPFRDLDRFTQQVLGTAARPAVMPMDAWREGDEFVVEFDLPGIDEESLDLDVERNVVTVRAERPTSTPAGKCWRPNGPEECSADNWCSAKTLIPTGSRRPTAAACCGCGSRSPSAPSPARSPSIAAVTARSSTPRRPATRDEG